MSTLSLAASVLPFHRHLAPHHEPVDSSAIAIASGMRHCVQWLPDTNNLRYYKKLTETNNLRYKKLTDTNNLAASTDFLKLDAPQRQLLPLAATSTI